MKLALLLGTGLLLSNQSIAYAGDSFECKRIYRTKISFFKTSLENAGITLTPIYLELSESHRSQSQRQDRLQIELRDLYNKVRQNENEISVMRNERPLLQMFSDSNPQNQKIAVLKKELAVAKAFIKEKELENGKLHKAQEKTVQQISNEVGHLTDMKTAIENLIWKQAQKSFKRPMVIAKSERNLLHFYYQGNQFYQDYTFTADIYGQSIKFKLRFLAGLRASKTGQMEAFVFAYNASSMNKLQMFALNESFKRNTVMTPQRKIFNGQVSIESKLKKLGFDLNQQKTKDLVNEFKKKALTDAKTAARAQELLEAAERRYADRISDSQSQLLNYYFYYMLYGNAATMYIPPTHWLLYNLNSTPHHQHEVGQAMQKAADLSQQLESPMSAESFDATLKASSSDILGIKDALGSDSYKSEIIDLGIARDLEISEDKVRQMDPEKADDPSYSGATAIEEQVSSGSVESLDRAIESNDSSNESSAESYSDSSSSDSGGGGGGGE